MSDNAMPVGKIGNVTISRLIIGGNQFSGWSHSRDLKYLRDLFKAYATEKNILETLRMAEENGVNTIITSASAYLSKYWKDWGGQMQWIAQVHPKTDDVTSDIKRAIDAGAVGAYVQGGVGDSFVKGGRVDLLGKAVEFIKSQRVLAGIGGHSLEVPMAVEKAGIQPDFYMKTLHHDKYWSATPREQRVEFNVDSNGPAGPRQHLVHHARRRTSSSCGPWPGRGSRSRSWPPGPSTRATDSNSPSTTGPTSSASACSTSRSARTRSSPRRRSAALRTARGPGAPDVRRAIPTAGTAPPRQGEQRS